MVPKPARLLTLFSQPIWSWLQESVRGAPPPDKKLLEHHFVFACIWAFGGCMLVDKVYDYRTQFSKWWISEWKVRGVAGQVM
jgi:hypothetical protein